MYLDFERWTLVMEFSTCWVGKSGRFVHDFESLGEKKSAHIESNQIDFFLVNSLGLNIKSFGWLKYLKSWC